MADSGIMSCVDPADEKAFWRHRLPYGGCIASLVAGDDKLYASGTSGNEVVLKADDRFEILAENKMDESIYASPAIADGTILMRTKTMLSCISSPGFESLKG